MFRASTLIQDLRVIHQENKEIFSCKQCIKTFKEKHTLKKHVLVVHEGFKVKCSQCPKTFGNDYNLQRHRISIHNKGIKGIDRMDHQK